MPPCANVSTYCRPIPNVLSIASCEISQLFCRLWKKCPVSGFGLKKFLDQFDHRAGKQQQRDEVRDAHQAVEGIGDVPQQVEFHRRAQNGHEGVDHEEGPHDLIRLAEELDAAGAVQAPADAG